MSLFLEFVAAISLGLGAALVVIGGIGINRFPDVFTRLHAASVAETGGVLLIALGLLCHAGTFGEVVRIVFLVLLLLFTSPLSSHALAQAALHEGQRPWLPRRNQRGGSK